MKNLKQVYFVVFVASVLGLIMLMPTESYSQGKTKEETLALFPQPVSGVFASSCVGCHNDQSQGKAKEFMNFSSWDKLTAKDQKKTSKEISKVVRKGIMPPPESVMKYPEEALTPEHKQTIQDWALGVKNGK
jgi:mono/diheme cytochrome c family protein